MFVNSVNYNLENFDIFVVSADNYYRLCQRFNSGQFNFGETKTFQCSNGPLNGVSVYFKKLAGGARNELALAEVFVYISSSCWFWGCFFFGGGGRMGSSKDGKFRGRMGNSPICYWIKF